MATQSKRTKTSDLRPDIEFYEVMQADLRQPYSSVFPQDETLSEGDEGTPVGRVTAIITLLSLVVAVGVLTFIVIAGLRAAIG